MGSNPTLQRPSQPGGHFLLKAFQGPAAPKVLSSAPNPQKHTQKNTNQTKPKHTHTHKTPNQPQARHCLASLLDYRHRHPGKGPHRLSVFPFLFFLSEDLFFCFSARDRAGKDTNMPPPTSRDKGALKEPLFSGPDHLACMHTRTHARTRAMDGLETCLRWWTILDECLF